MDRKLGEWEMPIAGQPSKDFVLGVTFVKGDPRFIPTKGHQRAIAIIALCNGIDFKDGGVAFTVNRDEAKQVMSLMEMALKEWEEAESKTTV